MTDEGRRYLTTPIYYVNDVPHVGHAYTTIAADAVTRARRLAGVPAFLLTGTDEHGQNIERIAREKGVSPQEHCDRIAARFRSLWERYDIGYDGFIRTTDAVHKRGVVALWERLRTARAPGGDSAVYRGKYAGWYCPRCEAFKTEDELRQPGNVCPDHELPCEWTEEENFFFRLSAFSGWLEEAISGPDPALRIDPTGRRNEVLAVVRQGLQDFSISRARVKWGIPVPGEPGHVFYVWMDALSNYVTALGYGEGDPGSRGPYEEWWEGAVERFHLVGKEIIRFHCLYWPAMLRAAEAPAPTRVFAHGHLTRNGRKLSKTTGNVIDPEALVSEWGPDAVRYFLLREGSFGQDWDFTDRALLGRYNSDLANDIGNLVSRTLTMVRRYCGGRVPPRASGSHAHGMVEGVLARYEALDFVGALSEVWALLSRQNQAIVSFEPWVVARDPARLEELQAFLYRCLEAVRIAAVLVSPVMPRAAARIGRMLGRGDLGFGPPDLEWGVLEPGSALGTIEPLFPRVETQDAMESKEAKPVPETKPDPPATPAAVGDKIDIADFARVELRSARILEAEKIAGSRKLVKLQVDLGDEKRQVVAGIAESYPPESLVGRSVVIVANLKPAKLMGVESNGMVLAGTQDGRAVLCTFAEDVPPGTRVK